MKLICHVLLPVSVKVTTVSRYKGLCLRVDGEMDHCIDVKGLTIGMEIDIKPSQS